MRTLAFAGAGQGVGAGADQCPQPGDGPGRGFAAAAPLAILEEADGQALQGGAGGGLVVAEHVHATPAQADDGARQVGGGRTGGVALAVVLALAQHPGQEGDERAAGGLQFGQAGRRAEPGPHPPALLVGVVGVVGGDLGGDGVGEVLGLGQALGGLHAVPGRPPFHEGLALGGGRVPRCGRCTVGLWGGAVIRSPAGPGRR
ncbi:MULTISPECIES: hypothetical protein [unclassified Streptomyces]|uniref:hypothetical protein n=1 Tax=unclassified Streptomyces TaxID=2593676 RepID=UPI0020367B64|nr:MULTISPECIES: hypothetical protein [unclassified Streptomyces]